MRYLRPRDDIGGNTFHVRDSYVWAEIQCLDSNTDYREYLPEEKEAQQSNRSERVTKLKSMPTLFTAGEVKFYQWAWVLGFLSAFLLWFLFSNVW